MYLKRYTVASLLLIGLVGWFIYVSTGGEQVSLSFMGINTPAIYIAVIVAIAMALLYIASLFHMGFYTLLGNFRLKKYEKDYGVLINAIYEAILAKPHRSHQFKTDRYKLLGKLVDNSTINPDASALLGIENEPLRNLMEIIYKVNKGEPVNLKKLNLPHDNPLMVQNAKNRYKAGEISAEEILINNKNYIQEFLVEVFQDFIETAPSDKIMKYYKDYITKSSFFKILNRIGNGENDLKFSVSEITQLVESVELSKKEYIEVAKAVAKGMMPEDRLELFKVLSEKDEEAMDAYLFTAFDLEMIDLADEILEASSPEEYQNFRAYKTLKECNHNYKIELFV
ncbi:MAG: hypothetical protein GXO11_05655 [Epsilonproteobacteria bacterium]|nr:hypothetical protein [Campylobacterota bacterium]